MPADQFALAIRGTTEELNCTTAEELLYTAHTRFKSINSFRTLLHEQVEDTKIAIQEAPIILLDPIKPIYGHKMTYSLQELSKNPNRKQEYRK